MGCLKLTYHTEREHLNKNLLFVVGGLEKKCAEQKNRVRTYGYGFNGQEKDDEISGNGNSYTATFWQYDSRLGRRWNLDPKPNPSISQYATFANNPIWFSDPFGDTLFNDQATETQDDLKLAAGKYSDLLVFGNKGEVSIDWGKAPAKVLEDPKKLAKYKRKALKTKGFGVLNSMINDKEAYFYGTRATKVSILDRDKNTTNTVLFPGTQNTYSFNNKDWFLQLNTNDYSASKKGFAPGNKKYSAMTFILPGTAYTGGLDAYGFKITIPRYNIVIHELNEAYQRTHGMYYEDAHKDYPILEFRYFIPD